METNLQKHWEEVYSEQDIEELGWYEAVPQPSLDMIGICNLPVDASILDVGVGSSTLIDNLLNLGYCNITALDISAKALETLKNRLSPEGKNCVQWIVDDLTQPKHLNRFNGFALWHDRAVLHFLTAEDDQQTYLATVKKVVTSGGFVIIAAFSLDGAEMCSGLPVHRYSKEMLIEFFGEDFSLISSFDYLYHQPWGDPRPYIYTLFRKK